LSNPKEIGFFFSPRMLQHDLEWYETHFEPPDGDKPKPVRGEIAPEYTRLKAWHVNRIANLLPELRIILTVRHPIDRAWSQAVLEFGYLKRTDIRKISSLDFLREVERAHNKQFSDYHRTIKIWSKAFGQESLHIAFFDRLQNDPQTFINGILRHIGAATPWALPEKFMKTKVHATSSLVDHQRDIPEVVQWYIADRLLKPTERLNELLDGRVSGWVDEMRTIRGKARLSWRILREVNRTVLSVPERLAFEAYHVILDIRLWRRWRHFQRSYVSDGDRSGIN
jgi:Sulfotransferase family